MLSVALAGTLVACEPGSRPTLHEVFLYGDEPVRITYAYGAPTQITIEGVEHQLTAVDEAAEAAPAEGAAGSDPLVVPGALLIDGAPYLREPIPPRDPPSEVDRIPLTTDLQLRTFEAVAAVLYFDGTSWFDLVGEAAAGLDTRVVPRVRIGRLRGLGALTTAEADALADALEPRGPQALTLLPEGAFPARVIDGLEEYLATGLYEQVGLPTDVTAFRPPPRRLQWELIARGDQALGVEAPTFEFVADEDQLLALWNRAYGTQLTVPPLPEVDFDRESIVAFFLGTKPTGGYGIDVEQVTLEDNSIFLDVTVREPAPGSIVTQALSSPWVIVRVLRGGVSVAWFRDATTGELIGVARKTR